MQLLVALHRADGAVVNKDDLIQLCWSGRVVGEDAINRVVSRLRHDLAKVVGDDLFVETITKVGYRLRNREAEERIVSAPMAATPIDRRQALWAGGIAFGATALGAFAWNRSQADNLPPEVSALLEQGRESLNGNTIEQLSNAVSQFRRATELAPESPEAWGALALAYR